jgi:hypothetical protein
LSDPTGLRSTTDAENIYINDTRNQINYLNSIGKNVAAQQMSTNLNALIQEIGGIPTVSGGNYLAPPPVENKVLGVEVLNQSALYKTTLSAFTLAPLPYKLEVGVFLVGVAIGTVGYEALDHYVLSGRSASYPVTYKPGNFETAKEDFWAKNPQNAQPRPNGTITGELPNGDRINVRPHSTDGGKPTLEIQDPNGKTKEKIRYND